MMKPESKKCPICGNNSVNVMIDAKIKCLVSDFGELYPINANLADIIRESEVLSTIRYRHRNRCCRFPSANILGMGTSDHHQSLTD